MRNRCSLYIVAGLFALSGCAHNAPPTPMAPPVAPQSAPPMAGAGGVPQGQNVYSWQDVPQGQQVPIRVGRFDQGGYQLLADTGETIVVPFVNQNLYAMRFGRSNTGRMYLVNEGDAPTLYLSPNDSLENASAQGARWYPLTSGFTSNGPVYIGVAPSWNAFTSMGWYPGMVAYGGMWGYSPYNSLAWMPGYVIHIGNVPYYSYNSYQTYYTSHPGYYRTSVVYHNYDTHSSTFFGANRPGGATGSFGVGANSRRFGSSAFSSGSFGTRRSSAFGGGAIGGSFGSRRRFGSSGTFGSGSFGTRDATTPALGGSGSGSFGGTPSFGGGQRSSGSSFGGTRSFGGGGSFGGGRSFGGSSFGGGRSFGGGGSFGRRH